MIKKLFCLAYFLCLSSYVFSSKLISRLSFNNNWEFIRDFKGEISPNLFMKSNPGSWEKTDLPHSLSIEPLITAKQWQGTAIYRKFFIIPSDASGKHTGILFEGAMHTAEVYLNGKLLKKHLGGYLPFYIDLTDKVKPQMVNCILIKLNNDDNPVVPPGKPIAELDFKYYSGIYRNTYLITKDRLHIPDPVQVEKVAGGGIMVTYSDVLSDRAFINVKTEVLNQHAEKKNAKIRISLSDHSGKTVAETHSAPCTLSASQNESFAERLEIKNPQLWSPENPYLYTLRVELLDDNGITDTESLRIGIRNLRFDKQGFYLNGQKYNIRGTNRHQEYPYLGYAISDEANYRDAFKIKDAGFNLVRLSHYPHSTAFIDACDQLGIMVIDAIPGWQFIGNKEFQDNSITDVRNMVRRDRNHPSIILWESSLNESKMPLEYMERAHKTVHEELPGPDVYTCGWMEQVFDVFIPARQHGKAPSYWKNYNKKPLLIAEYGDWEYYAQNAGFNQKEFKDLKQEERSSRQLRGAGEKRLLQQAFNYQESHNDNLKGSAAGDANWLMFDYTRGYAPDIESSGIMDIFRLPKYSFWFYKSQREVLNKPFYEPFVYIANYWKEDSPKNVTVYSNCEEVEFFVNGKTVARQRPDSNLNTDKLHHPPFTFTIADYKPGSLKAVGYIDGKKVADQTVKTPGQACKLLLKADISGKKLKAGRNDLIFIYASLADKNGTVVPNTDVSVLFDILQGDARLIGNPVTSEAGIATVLLQAGRKPGKIKLKASSPNIKDATVTVEAY